EKRQDCGGLTRVCAFCTARVLRLCTASVSVPAPVGRRGHRLPARADDLDVEIADLLPQRVAIDAQKVRGPDLIAARRRQRRGEQRLLHLTQDAVIETRRRQTVAELGEVA